MNGRDELAELPASQLAFMAALKNETAFKGDGRAFRAGFDAALAWKLPPKPRTVTTAAELDALPVGSVVLVDDKKCGDECAWQLFDDVTELRDEYGDKARQAWGSAAYIHEMSSADLFKLGPATVLHEPTT